MTSGGKITDSGREIMIDRTFNTSPTRGVVSKFKVGIGTTEATVSDTDLQHPIPLTGTESVDNCDTADWNDSADMTTSLNSTTYKQGSYSLNLTKDAGTSADVSTYKTTTSRDFTSKELSIWVYIKDATAYAYLATTDCLTIRFGSDDSNYYEWTKDNSDLSLGWNLIDNLTSSNADSTTGSPVIASCDYTFIQLTATGTAITWSDGDFLMDDIKVVSSDDYTKTFETGYPSLDYTNLQVTIRTRVPTTMANGYALSEIGIFNTDSTPLMESRDLFSAISKGSSDELVFISKVLIE